MRESGLDKLTPVELVVFGAHYSDYLISNMPSSDNSVVEGATSAGLWGVYCFRVALALADWSEANPDTMPIDAGL